jgi:hypothetical protein
VTLILPDAPDPYGDGTNITPRMHLDAVEHQLARARCLADVTAVECDLWEAHRTRMRLRVLRPWINEALALCALRRTELAAEGREARPALSGPCPIGDC